MNTPDNQQEAPTVPAAPTKGTFAQQAQLSQILRNNIMQHYFEVHGQGSAAQMPAYVVEGIGTICQHLSQIGNDNPTDPAHWKGISTVADLVCDSLPS